MNDSSDGSSNAAQRAQPDGPVDRPEDTPEADDQQGGFFRRLLGGVIGPSDDHPDDMQDSTVNSPGRTSPGLGNLARMVVEDVAIPKAEIVAVAADISKPDLVKVFRDSGLTRLPVYEGTLDTPIGFAHLKDFALKHGFNGDSPDFSLSKMLRPLLFVPPSMSIGVLLQKMQAERRHMALVIDEYGGVDGLLTIEDLIEQVVGEIEDEHDIDEGHYWTEEAPGIFVALAKTPLDEIEPALGLSLTEHDEVDDEEIETLGGLVFMLLGRVPVRGEVVEHPSGATIEVLEADPRRIKRLRLRRPDRARG